MMLARDVVGHPTCRLSMAYLTGCVVGKAGLLVELWPRLWFIVMIFVIAVLRHEILLWCLKCCFL